MRIDNELKRKLEGIRGEVLEDAVIPSPIPCNETSDSDSLCKHPVVSVYMLAYNHEKYIQQAIDGVVQQKADFEYELIIAEDCSPDETRRICLENQKKYPDKIRVLWSNENVGAKLNTLRARAACRGEFIALCEGDDYWVNPDKLQKQVELMRRYPQAGICFAGNDIYYEFNGYFSAYDPAKAPKEYYDWERFYRKVLFTRGSNGFYVQNMHTSTFLIRRATLETAMRRFEDAYAWQLKQGDVTLLMSIALISGAAFLGERCSVYRMNDGGMTRRIGFRSLMDGDFLKIYFCMQIFGWTFDQTFALFANMFVNRWVKIALEGDAVAQRELSAKIAKSEYMTKAFNRWYSRGLMKAISDGSLTRKRYKLLRPIFVIGARIEKWMTRRRYGVI